METQRRAMIAFILAACVIMTALSLGVHRAEPPKPTVRIGVYDNRAVAVAYFRSEAAQQQRKEMLANLEAARKDGNTPRAEQLAHAFDRMQWSAHRQGFGTAGVEDAMAHVRAGLPDVAKAANLCAVVCNPDYLSVDQVERVDVTDQVVALFKPDEQTLNTIRELRKVKPVDVGFDFED